MADFPEGARVRVGKCLGTVQPLRPFLLVRLDGQAPSLFPAEFVELVDPVRGHDAGFAAANVEDPWAEQKPVDGELRDRIAEVARDASGTTEGSQQVAPIYWDDVASVIYNRVVAPVLAAKDAEIERWRGPKGADWEDEFPTLSVAEYSTLYGEIHDALHALVPDGWTEGSPSVMTMIEAIRIKLEGWEAVDRLHKQELLKALGMDPLRDWDDIRNAAAGIRKDRDFAVATRQQYAEERDAAIKEIHVLADALVQAQTLLRQRNKAYGRASATIGQLRSEMARLRFMHHAKLAELHAKLDTGEAKQLTADLQRQTDLVEELRKHVLALEKTNDRERAERYRLQILLADAATALAKIADRERWESPPELKDRIELVASELDALKTPPAALQDPITYYEGGDEDDPRYPLVAWALNSSATISFAFDEGGHTARVSVAGQTQSKGIALRSVTADQIRSYANQLLAMVRDTEASEQARRARIPGETWCDQCGDYVSGSHYHCSKCGQRSSMMGHRMGCPPQPVEVRDAEDSHAEKKAAS
jgi:hypothetical protein